VHAPFPARRSCLGIGRAWERYWWRTQVAGVGQCDGAGVVPGVHNGGRIELYVSAEDGISESVSVGVCWRPALRTSQ
jgi:hypothetical protein